MLPGKNEPRNVVGFVLYKANQINYIRVRNSLQKANFIGESLEAKWVNNVEEANDPALTLNALVLSRSPPKYSFFTAN